MQEMPSLLLPWVTLFGSMARSWSLPTCFFRCLSHLRLRLHTGHMPMQSMRVSSLVQLPVLFWDVLSKSEWDFGSQKSVNLHSFTPAAPTSSMADLSCPWLHASH
ncbi:hypothetical protein EDD86DRAFT_215296 [Gorgonomyces haynaldii]|nr:hypothetical protein EDD86DRAFT_215296 [Gorgonomyces haynaldii]